MAKRSKKERLNSYIAFFDRAFSDQNIEDIISNGGSSSLYNFKEVSKDKTKNLDYWNALFNQKKGNGDNLGKEIYKRFIEDQRVNKNARGRMIVRKGSVIDFNNKAYKGGQFIPRDYFARITNR